MPQMMTMDDGSEVEVFTQEELEAAKKEVQESASNNEEVETLRSQLKERDELIEQSSPEGIKNLRNAYKRAKSALKERGIEVDESGNVAEKPAHLTEEETRAIAAQEAQKLALDSVVTAQLKGFSEEERAVVRRQFEKLTHGEEVNLENVHSFLGSAVRASDLTPPRPANVSHASLGITGRGPKYDADTAGKKRFSDTDRGKEAAKTIFGEDSLINNQ